MSWCHRQQQISRSRTISCPSAFPIRLPILILECSSCSTRTEVGSASASPTVRIAKHGALFDTGGSSRSVDSLIRREVQRVVGKEAGALAALSRPHDDGWTVAEVNFKERFHQSRCRRTIVPAFCKQISAILRQRGMCCAGSNAEPLQGD